VNDPAHDSSSRQRMLPSIVRDEPDWFVVNKPIGWHSVQERVTDGDPTIEQWIGEAFPDQRSLPDSGLVHRLDHSTSGCLLVAKNVQMHETLRENFSAGFGGWSIEKKYLALVARGLQAQGEFALYFSNRHKGSAKVTVKEIGARAELGKCRWTVMRAGRSHGDSTDPHACDLVEIDLIGPGRRHQIRAGLSSLGHALAGDSLYRGAPLDARWNDGHAALHAWKLTISGTIVESPRPAWAHGLR